MYGQPVSTQGGHGIPSEAKPPFHEVFLLLSPAEARAPVSSYLELFSERDIQRAGRAAFGPLRILPLLGKLNSGLHLQNCVQGLPKLTLGHHH